MHALGFFYQLMPAFCVGAAVDESIGDWKTAPGPLPVDSEVPRRLVPAVHAAGMDVVVAAHGGGPRLHAAAGNLFDTGNLPALIPVFINCAAPPLPPMARVHALGRAIGEFVKTLDRRVLLLASGGPSHDPPVPLLAGAAPQVRERLIAGGVLSAQARTARQAGVLAAGERHAAGTSSRIPLNPDWDRAFLAALEAGDLIVLPPWKTPTSPRRPATAGVRCAPDSPPSRRFPAPARTARSAAITAPSPPGLGALASSSPNRPGRRQALNAYPRGRGPLAT